MKSNLTFATVAFFTVALFGLNAPSATAQGFGGFLNVNTNGVSISLGARNCNCDSAFYWRNDRRRVWCAETFRTEFVPAAFRTEYDCYGRGRQILVRAAFNRRICVPGHWDYVDQRVRVRRPGHICRVHNRGNRGGINIFSGGNRNRNDNRGRNHRSGNRRDRGVVAQRGGRRGSRSNRR